MALEPKTESTAFWVAKWGALLVGVISTTFMVVRVAVPFSRDLVASTLPAFWTTARGYLSPPYLFVTLNFIILIIWKLSEKAYPENEHAAPEATPPKQVGAVDHHLVPSSPRKPPQDPWQSPSPFHSEVHVYQPPVPVAKSPESSPEAHSDSSCITTDSDENPPASSPHSRRRDANRVPLAPVASPAAVTVDDPQPEPQSLDATWQVISGGRPRPVMKKSETWDVPPTVEAVNSPLTALVEMKKSETFRRRVAAEQPAPAPTLRTEALVAGHDDELNQRFEAFIKKVNDQMRLQRQESHQRTAAMMNRLY